MSAQHGALSPGSSFDQMHVGVVEITRGQSAAVACEGQAGQMRHVRPGQAHEAMPPLFHRLENDPRFLRRIALATVLLAPLLYLRPRERLLELELLLRAI